MSLTNFVRFTLNLETSLQTKHACFHFIKCRLVFIFILYFWLMKCKSDVDHSMPFLYLSLGLFINCIMYAGCEFWVFCEFMCTVCVRSECV